MRASTTTESPVTINWVFTVQNEQWELFFLYLAVNAYLDLLNTEIELNHLENREYFRQSEMTDSVAMYPRSIREINLLFCPFFHELAPTPIQIHSGEFPLKIVGKQSETHAKTESKRKVFEMESFSKDHPHC